MFEYLTGVLTEKYALNNGFFFVVDVNGIGYKVEVSENDYLTELKKGNDIKIYTKLIHKEDVMLLCGFLKRESRDLFDYLISVSGVGLKMALTLLGKFSTYDLISIVINEEYKQLTLAKGVGIKLAQKIILELKDKLLKSNIIPLSDNVSQLDLPETVKDTTSILLSLGYHDDEINSAYKIVIPKCKNSDNSEELLREVLKYLSM